MLSVILPCYNPPPQWHVRVAEMYEQMESTLRVPVELILVNDGSGEGISTEHVSFLEHGVSRFHYIHYPDNKGKGYAIREGVRIAGGDVMIYTDIDFPYTMDSLYRLYAKMAVEHFDAVAGIKDEDYYQYVPVLRRRISQLFRCSIGLFMGLPVTDTQCGLKGFTRKVLPVFLALRTNGYLFDLEFITSIAGRKDIEFATVPVTLNKGVVFRKMNYRILFPEFLNFVRIVFRKGKHGR